MGKPFSTERLTNIRRIRKARRLFKQVPLFAYSLLEAEIPGYTYACFLADLKTKKTRSKKKHSRAVLVRYGRFNQMNRLLEQYRDTGDISFALKAIQLRKVMTKPYRVIIQKNGTSLEFGLSPLIPYTIMEQLVKELSACKSLKEAETHFIKFKKNSHIL